MAEIKIVPIFDENTKASIIESVKKNDALRPFIIWFDPPYDEVAFYLEHGTGPAKKKESARADGKRAYDRIGDWVTVQFRYESKNRQRFLKNKMYNQIMKVGTPPHPFIRSAVAETFDSGDFKRILSEGGTTRDIAQLIVDRMVEHLDRDKRVKFSDGDSIVKHIHWSLLDPGEDYSDAEITQKDILTEWEQMDEQRQAEYDARLAQYRRGGMR